MAGEDSFDQEEGLSRAFWAVELVPGKEFSTILPLDLKITQAVLPASAKDTGRSVVSITFVDEPSKTLSIVSLKLDSNDSQSLEVVLDEDSEVKFTVSGKNPVHLSGYYVPNQEGPEGFYDDEDDEIDSDEVGDEIDDDESEEEEASPQILAALEKKRKAAQNGAEANKKVKSENAPQQPKKEASTPNKPQQQQPKGQQQQKGAQQNQQKAFPNGLKYTITKEGTGAEATKGKKVGVRYVGKLTKNNKVFDAAQGKPFVFTLAAGEVIKGWDLGVAGMKVGEKRTLIIPSELGYGARGAGKDIPPNSSLTFDVELVHVNGRQ